MEQYDAKTNEIVHDRQQNQANRFKINEAITVALISLAAIQLGHLVQNYLSNSYEKKQIILDKKREVYFRFISNAITLFTYSMNAKEKLELGNRFNISMMEIALIAPDKVLEKVIEMKRISKMVPPAPMKIVYSLFDAIKVMREDARDEITQITPEQLQIVIVNPTKTKQP